MKTIIITYILLYTISVSYSQEVTNHSEYFVIPRPNYPVNPKRDKYITRKNYKQIPVADVKYMACNVQKKRRLPRLMKRFIHTEGLELYAPRRGRFVRWAGGKLCTFQGRRLKGKIRRLPRWLTHFSKLKKLHLSFLGRLKIKPLLKFLTNFKDLHTLTLEINQREVKLLNRFEKLPKLKYLTIQIENPSSETEARIRAVLGKFKGLKLELYKLRKGRRLGYYFQNR